jgi:hypothetical protein
MPPASVTASLAKLRYRVVRLAGADRYSTSLVVAVNGLGAPSTAGHAGGAVLLTKGPAMTAALRSYLNRYKPTSWAVGRPAAAAVRFATPLTARTSTDTAVGASSVSPSVAGYLDASSGSLNAVLMFGRPTVPAPGVLTAIARLARGRIPR